jgi:hypothetical protein
MREKETLLIKEEREKTKSELLNKKMNRSVNEKNTNPK